MGIFVIPLQTVFTQTCGFGCLGLSGIYAGYSIQRYNADGLNTYIQNELASNELENEFGEGRGFRIGANIFRAKFQGYFLSAKGYYQFLKEENSYQLIAIDFGQVSRDYTLKMDHWALGVDFGFPVTSFLDWKLVEGGLNFYMIEMKHKMKTSNGNISEIKYESNQIQIGYYVGSGILIQIIEDYISLEGTASYSIFNIEELSDPDREKIAPAETAFLEGGNFGASVQLNLGIPL